MRRPGEAPDEAAVKHVRGSALFLSGHAISKVLNGASQILLARSLMKGEYGAFAYGLSFVALAEVFTTLGLTRVITRYVPVYEERKEYGKALGTLVVVFGTIVALGLALVLLVNAFSGQLGRLLIDDQRTVSLLAIFIALTPIESLNQATDGVLAVLGRPGAIFVRKHLLGPGLRLGVVGLLIARDASVRTLAFGYVFVASVGLVAYGGMLVRALSQYVLPKELGLPRIQVPVREITTFVIPLFTAGLVAIGLEVVDVLILGRFGGPAEVAELRAVQPVSRLVRTVSFSFGLLFAPMAARLYARDERSALNEHYWQTATWVTVISFPLFASAFVFPGQITIAIYGSQYQGSAPVLALLTLGYFLHGSLGQNEHVLAVYRQLRYLVVVNVCVLLFSIAVQLLLAPPFGAVGAAAGHAGSLLFFNLLLQAGLRRGTGVKFFDTRVAPFYLMVAAAVLGLATIQRVLSPPLVYALLVTGVVWLLLLAVTRRSLQIAQMFPELKRIPLVRYLVADEDRE